MSLTLEQARDRQNSYYPNVMVISQNRRIILVPVVGATAVGKNYIMSASGYHVVGTTVTREPRADDNASKYTYVTNEALLTQIDNGAVVQYAVSPTAPTIYCSLPTDYAYNQPNIMDCFYDAVEGLKRKGFQTVRTISIIASGEQWERQMRARYKNNEPSYVLARLKEAEQSLAWSWQQYSSTLPDHLLVINHRGNVDDCVRVIHDFVGKNTFKQPDKTTVQRLFDEMATVITDYRQELSA